MADITKKVPIYVHFVEKLQTFDLRTLGPVFVEKSDGGQLILFYDRGSDIPSIEKCQKVVIIQPLHF